MSDKSAWMEHAAELRLQAARAEETADSYANEAIALRTQRDELLEALQGIFKLIDTGRLVRNIDQDANPDWALRQLELVTILKLAQTAMDKAGGK